MVVVLVALLVLVGAGTAVFLMSEGDSADTAAPATTSPAAPTVADPPPATRATPAEPGAVTDAAVGDCIKVNDVSATAADIETIDCADPLAVYEVAVREESTTRECPNRNYVSYTEDDVLLLCLTLNAKEGQCFHEDSQQDTPVGCDSPDASYRVGEIHEGTEDANRCGEADARNALTYPVPPLTICRLEVG